MLFQFLAGTLALAASCTTAFAAPGSFDKLNNSVSVYAGKQSIGYTEHDLYKQVPTDYLDKEDGKQTNVGMRLRLTGPSGPLSQLYGELDMHRSRGTTDYDGYLVGGGVVTPYKTSGHRADTDDVRLRVGYSFDFKDVRLTPFAAAASHKWARMDDGVQYEYRENYSHRAVGVGALLQVALQKDYFLELDATVGRTTRARMEVPSDAALYHLQSRDWAQVGMTVTKFFSKNFYLSTSLSIDHWKYGESEVIGGMFEPESTSDVKHLRLGVGYSF